MIESRQICERLSCRALTHTYSVLNVLGPNVMPCCYSRHLCWIITATFVLVTADSFLRLLKSVNRWGHLAQTTFMLTMDLVGPLWSLAAGIQARPSMSSCMSLFPRRSVPIGGTDDSCAG